MDVLTMFVKTVRESEIGEELIRELHLLLEIGDSDSGTDSDEEE
jgi:hypothetical protein